MVARRPSPAPRNALALGPASRTLPAMTTHTPTLPPPSQHYAALLPGDPERGPKPRAPRKALFSFVEPTPVAAPRALVLNEALGIELGLSPEVLHSPTLLACLAGNAAWPGATPYAMTYGGHQFGTWAGQLGDGRAINLGDLFDQAGHRQSLQLKGAGPTPYSRGADGRAVLRSSLREYVCSEAMAALGVPTTRALALLTTGDGVLRDRFYNGQVEAEPGAIVCRVAESFLRFGHFELLAARQEPETLQTLLDYLATHHFPELSGTGKARTLALYEAICRRTAALVAKWTGLGFVHGVLNTDNLSVLGLTIDYGPYGWLDRYTPGWTPNTSDHGGRYRFEQQAAVAQWNLAQLGNALYLVVEDAPALQAILNDFETHYRRCWQDEMAAKLGLSRFEPRDEGLVSELLGLMEEAQVDPTLCFRQLANVPAIEAVRTGAPRGPALTEALAPCFYDDAPLDHTRQGAWEAWILRYGARLHADPADPATRRERMNGKNPAIIPRNYLTQQAIDGLAEGDEAPLQRLLAGLSRPYAPAAEDAPLLGRRPAWAEAHPGCTALSCSS